MRLGEHVRAARLEAGLSQEEVAAAANVSVGAVRSLERGHGSSLRTLVQVIRALGRESWFDALAPQVQVSPLSLLVSKRVVPVRDRRVRRS